MFERMFGFRYGIDCIVYPFFVVNFMFMPFKHSTIFFVSDAITLVGPEIKLDK